MAAEEDAHGAEMLELGAAVTIARRFDRAVVRSVKSDRNLMVGDPSDDQAWSDFRFRKGDRKFYITPYLRAQVVSKKRWARSNFGITDLKMKDRRQHGPPNNSLPHSRLRFPGTRKA